jgi:hypothetical protein
VVGVFAGGALTGGAGAGRVCAGGGVFVSGVGFAWLGAVSGLGVFGFGWLSGVGLV